MDTLMLIIFFVMIVIIIAVFIYMAYDYINYKKAVDDTIEETVKQLDELNTEFEDNLTSAEDNLNKKITTTNADVASLKVKHDSVFNNTSNVGENVNNFDVMLKRYFKFSDNNQEISNKLFDYQFKGINPKIDILQNVNAVSGLSIKSGTTLRDSKNLKVCDNNNNECIYMNVNQDGFHIVPDQNVGNMTIRSKNDPNNVFAKFDFANSSIYLGGSNTSAPIYTQNNKFFVNELNLRYKNPQTQQYEAVPLTGDYIRNWTTGVVQKMHNISNLHLQETTQLRSALNNLYSSTSNLYSNVDLAIVNYELILLIPSSITSATTNSINFNITPLTDLYNGDKIIVNIPSINLEPTSDSKTYNANNSATDIVNNAENNFTNNASSFVQNSDIKLEKIGIPLSYRLTLTITNSTPKNTLLSLSFTSTTSFGLTGTISKTKNYSTSATIQRIANSSYFDKINTANQYLSGYNTKSDLKSTEVTGLYAYLNPF
jgi:uncharacterized protein YoxC